MITIARWYSWAFFLLMAVLLVFQGCSFVPNRKPLTPEQIRGPLRLTRPTAQAMSAGPVRNAQGFDLSNYPYSLYGQGITSWQGKGK